MPSRINSGWPSCAHARAAVRVEIDERARAGDGDYATMQYGAGDPR